MKPRTHSLQGQSCCLLEGYSSAGTGSEWGGIGVSCTRWTRTQWYRGRWDLGEAYRTWHIATRLQPDFGRPPPCRSC